MRLSCKQRIDWTSRNVASVGQILQCGRAANRENLRAGHDLSRLAHPQRKCALHLRQHQFTYMARAHSMSDDGDVVVTEPESRNLTPLPPFLSPGVSRLDDGTHSGREFFVCLPVHRVCRPGRREDEAIVGLCMCKENPWRCWLHAIAACGSAPSGLSVHTPCKSLGYAPPRLLEGS